MHNKSYRLGDHSAPHPDYLETLKFPSATVFLIIVADFLVQINLLVDKI